jgi:hypothetical protein
MTDTVKVGTIMVQDNAPMPNSLVGAQPYSGGWSVVIDPNRSQLGRELEGAGWIVSDTAGEMRTTGFGLNRETMIRNAVVQAVKAAKLWAFNSLELTEVTRKVLVQTLQRRALDVRESSTGVHQAARIAVQISGADVGLPGNFPVLN